MKGYRYLEEENSDESDSEFSGDEEHEDGHDDEEGHGTEEEEVLAEAVVRPDGDAVSMGSQDAPVPRGRRRRHDDAYEQAGVGEEYAQRM